MSRFVAPIVIACAITPSFAQSTVPYASPAWQDFGTTNITGVTGNFLPGWTALTASPDLGDDLFAIPTTSLSGAPDDAALWLLQVVPSAVDLAANESVRLSLSGFTIGEFYTLDFFATIVSEPFASWDGNDDQLDVSITGADIIDWDSTTLNDPVDSDGMNVWVPQSIGFTALNSTVEFDFGANPAGIDIGNAATRFGIDGLTVLPVPGPGSAATLWAGVLCLGRRRCRV